MSGPSERELSNLSDAEREALAGAEDEAGDPPDQGGDDGDEAQGQEAKAGTEGGGKAADGAVAAAAPVDTKADAAAAGDAGGVPAGVGSGDPPAAKAEDEVVPPLRVATLRAPEIPADIDDQIKGVDKEITDLEQKLEEGDIQTKEFSKELRKLTDKRQDLRDLRRDAERVHSTNLSSRDAAWDSAQDAFYDANPEFKGSPILEGALDAALRGLYRNEKYRSADFLWLLNRAAEQVKETMGTGKAAAAPANGDGKPALKQTPAAARLTAQQQRAAADRQRVPVTTGGLPQAGADSPAGDEFSHLDNLAGMELEAAVARLTPLQRDKYLSM
jgi:hypothetical protein